ncbi:Flagellar FliJ protein [Desulfosporosinus acidiphilus SJ4]|uniref:Flagellar FliJ protein n=1 Tax=Desulfosporosinus acidiphilus (strain DSM 22704 / JCM 16185 / SJ4) TaxID=646529 RepID=I4DA80_DESAJ|nr:flagellar FliJ family protein [Desulfosporosinus acidiphilus]AFM42704.1 Flagellar FliJ protein [Desulfosporosinus acidiphilus SJ4]
MARFRFRFDASQRLADQLLDVAKREFAQEMQRLQVCIEARVTQLGRFNDALEGQRNAGLHSPEKLAIWQTYVFEQRRRLKEREAEKSAQEVMMEKARCRLIEAHREAEKFRRLKEKQFKAFQIKELIKEQKVLDETGQILHWQQKKYSTKC